MGMRSNTTWEKNHHMWRDPMAVCSQSGTFRTVPKSILEMKTYGPWWDLLDELGVHLLVSREYEHLLMNLGVCKGSPRISYIRIPHPSGIAIDKKRNIVYVTSTRNPNQLYEFQPVQLSHNRSDIQKLFGGGKIAGNFLIPHRVSFYPGGLYIHDIVYADNELYANAVGHNAIVSLRSGVYSYEWWPKCVDKKREKFFNDRNYLQLNSIAFGKSLKDSFFSASSAVRRKTQPGDKNFPVDKEGVIFSGATREPVCFGLTRPHSCRIYRKKLYVANSGYGEVRLVNGHKSMVVNRFQSWTRGVYFYRGIMFIGLSRVIPRYKQYAPGLDCTMSRCGIVAIALKSGKMIARVEFMHGNQIFAIEGISGNVADGFPCKSRGNSTRKKIEKIFYTFHNKR